MLRPHRCEIRSKISALISLFPFSYRESWPWLIPCSRANFSWFVSKPRSSRRRLPTAFQSILPVMEYFCC